jgi:aryl-alcohol dehydrogenase-like predicted oxidoreductase
MKLGLGTAQFGQRYGIAGGADRPGPETVAEILGAAADAGVTYLDTAPAYGESEALLGRALGANHPFRIVTKTPVFRRPMLDGEAGRVVTEAARASLARLGQERLYGLLVHDAEDLLADGGESIFDSVRKLRDSGLVSRIGVSVYDARQIDRVLERYRIDLIQLPLSALDQRLVRSGHIAKMKSSGIEVHARSLFLQGLMLLDPERLPAGFEPVRGHLEATAERARGLGLSPLEAALAYARDGAAPDVGLCGVETAAQLREVRAALDTPPPDTDWSTWALDDPRWVDPRRWETGASR